jgi:hypothetical protein
MSARENSRGGFYQFPLCLLAQTVPFEHLLNSCLRHGVCWYLDTTYQGWRSTTRSKLEGAFDEARTTIGFTGGATADFIATHTEAQRFIDRWQDVLKRKTAFVRLRTSDLHFDVRDKGILSEREWRILAAIFSAIGDKPMVRLGWERIQCRAAGWLTPPPLGAKPCGPLYPRGQIERSLRELLDRGYLFGATYRRGERWWSNRLSHEELRGKILERKLHAAKAAQRRKIDSLGDTRIALKLAEYGLVPAPLRAPAQRQTAILATLAAGDNGASLGPPGARPSPQFRIVAG